METLHPDAAAIDRLGVDMIVNYFGLTRQAVYYWRKKGVPKYHRHQLAMLGATAGHEMPELRRDRAAVPC